MDKKTKNPTAKRRFRNDEAGQGLAEYALILSLAALVVFVIINLVGPAIGDVFSRLVQRAPVAPPSLTSYTPAPTYTPTQTVNPYSTPTNTATATPPGNTATPTTTSTVTNTPTATPTSTPTCTGFGPYAAPGRVEMENFMCGGPDIAFVDSGGDGGPGSGVYRADVTIQGPDLRAATDSGGGYQLDWLVANEWVQYKINAAETRFYDLSMRYAAGNANGRFRLEIWRNGSRIYASSSLAVPNSGGDTIWNNMTVSQVPFLAGTNEIRLVIENGGFALNYFDVSLPVPTATPTVTPTPIVCYSLTTAVTPANSGSITRNPAPNCGGDSYTQGTAVTLSASPNTDYQFTSWSGGATGTSSSAVVTMNSAKSVTANFSAACYTVTTAVSPSGSGTITASPGPNCGSQYTHGTSVTFTANPAANRSFSNWSGSLSGINNPASLTIVSAANIMANFNTSTIIVSENFEDEWAGGTGWSSNWSHANESAVVTSGTPHGGSYHLELRDNGSAERGADLSGLSSATLSFFWKVTSLASNEAFYAQISANNGSTWTTIHTANSSNDGFEHVEFTFPLPSTYLTSGFKIKFYGINNNDGTDHFYVDDITITSN